MTRPPLLRAVSAVAVLTVVLFAQVGLVLAPSQLGRHPLLVLALRPTPAFLVLIGDAVPALAAIAVAVAGRTAVDLAYFATARHGAAPFLRRFGLGRQVTGALSRRTASRGLLAITFFWSSSPVIAALGVGRTSAWLFLAVTAAGNLATSTIYVLSGRRLSGTLAPLDAWVSANGLRLTAALVILVTLTGVLTYRRNRGADVAP